MTPRVEVTAIEKDAPLDEIKKAFIETKFSRLPVYDENMDHIIGILSEKDLASQIFMGRAVNISECISKPMFVNENMKLDDMIRQMQKEKKHMAIVVDEHGGTNGIITLEDAIEEVWGEIYDEHDEVKTIEFQRLDDNVYIADAEIEIEKLFENLGIEHLPSNNYSSLGAFLFELAEKSLPKQDQILDFTTIDERVDEDANYYEVAIVLHFKLIKVEHNRIRQVMITTEVLNSEENEESEKEEINEKAS